RLSVSTFPTVLGCLLLFSLRRPRPRSTLFPYTTLFRSVLTGAAGRGGEGPPGRVRHPAAGARRWQAHRRTGAHGGLPQHDPGTQDRKSTRLNSSHVSISYAVFCLKKKKIAVEAAYTAHR